jgi:hypothetical protein
MAVGDHGAVNGAHGIDVEIAGLAIETRRARREHGLGPDHTLNYRRVEVFVPITEG